MNKEIIKIHRCDDLKNMEIGGVYLIRNLDNGLLKIGLSGNLKNRYKQICSTFKHIGINPNLDIEVFMECECYKELESYLHKEFDKYREQNEWFKINDINIILNKVELFEYNPDINNDSIQSNKEAIVLNNSPNNHTYLINETEEHVYYRLYLMPDVIIWRTKIKDINILLNKINYILDENINNPYHRFDFYSGLNDNDIIIRNIDCDIVKQFEYHNTDCIVNSYSRNREFKGTFNFYDYIKDSKLNFMVNKINSMVDDLNLKDDEKLDINKLKECESRDVYRELSKKMYKFEKFLEISMQ